jgi:nucleoside-diphosphate-sugar epimerase
MESSEANPINLGNPHEVTIEELARAVLKLIPDTGSRITYLPLPQDDPIRRKPDISLAQRGLQWSPKVSFKEGLTATVAYFRKKIEHEYGA